MTVFRTVNMLMGFVISLSFSTSFSCPENGVMHPVSLKVAALMIGCWSKDIWASALSEMGQGELMGSICCTRIPFILVMISQSHLSLLLKSYSSNPLVDLKTHFGTSTVVLFFVMILTTPYAYQPMFYV